MNWVREYTPNNSKNQLYRTALVITVVGNIALAIGKGIAAYLSGSVACMPTRLTRFRMFFIHC
jgi:hypothetical protein